MGSYDLITELALVTINDNSSLFFLRRTTLQQKTKAFSGLSTRDSLYQCLLWYYVHLVLYCFCTDISNTKWSNTWYHIHSISAGIPSLSISTLEFQTERVKNVLHC